MLKKNNNNCSYVDVEVYDGDEVVDEGDVECDDDNELITIYHYVIFDIFL